MDRPLILFGAFDRHNFGDLLLARVAAAQWPGRELHFAGLADRDLRRWDGLAVRALPDLLAELAPRRPDLLHVGGEILDCSAWQAAVMLLAPEQAQAVIAYLEPRPAERADWVRGSVGTALAPYVASSVRLPGLCRTAFAGVGGVGLAQAPEGLRAEVLAALRAASFVSVRDRITQATLAQAGIAARLLPDPAVRVAELFGRQVRQRADMGEIVAARAAFPSGYLALQLGPDWRQRPVAQARRLPGRLGTAWPADLRLARRSRRGPVAGPRNRRWRATAAGTKSGSGLPGRPGRSEPDRGVF